MPKEAVLWELFPPCSLHTSTSLQGSWIQILLVAQASGIPLHDDKLNLIVCRCSEAGGCGLLERTLLQTRQKPKLVSQSQETDCWVSAMGKLSLSLN